MTIKILFSVLIGASCGSAILLGGRDGRWVSFFYIMAIIGTHFARVADPSWSTVHLLVLAVDTALLLGLLWVAYTSDRYWPIWMAGLHLLTVAAHFQVLVAGTFGFRSYFLLESIWSLPKLLILLIGVILDWEYQHDGRRRRPR